MKYIQKWDKRQESLKMRAFREVKLPLPPKLAGTALTLALNSDEHKLSPSGVGRQKGSK